MQEQIVGFDVAKLAKDKGFNLEVKAYFDFKKFGVKPLEFFNKIDANFFSHWDFDLNKKNNAGYISAPAQSFLQKWLREKHNIHIEIELTDNTTEFYYQYTIVDSKNREYHDEDMIDQAKSITNWELKFPTFEEALEAGLFEALKLIKNEN